MNESHEQISRIDDLQLHSRIGAGGGGIVYRAVDPQSGRVLALKLISHIVRPDAIERFQQELEVLARLDHPAIPKIRKLGCSSHGWFLACDFVEGNSVRRI